MNLRIFFLQFFLFGSVSGFSIWIKDPNQSLSDCNTKKEVIVRRVRNNERVRIGKSSETSQLVRFRDIFNPFVYMFGFEKNGFWYFIEVRNGRARLKKNRTPTSAVSQEDLRLFRHVKWLKDDANVFIHTATREYLNFDVNRVVTVRIPEKATNICF